MRLPRSESSMAPYFSSLRPMSLPPTVRRLVVAVSLFVSLAFLAWPYSARLTRSASKRTLRRDNAPPIGSRLNALATGLADIFVVSLSEGKTRRKMIEELATLSGLEVKFVDAVDSRGVEVNLTRTLIPEVCQCPVWCKMKLLR